MTLNIDREVATLRRMTAKQLRERYAEAFGEPTRSGNRDCLVKRIAWRLQALEEGTLSERARRRAEELAKEADIRLTPPRTRQPRPTGPRHTAAPAARLDPRLPMPGTLITRSYKGETLHVTVLEKGFEYEGEVYRSISAVASAITGSHLNGFAFFNLGPEGGGSP